MQKKESNILITGAKGFLGQNLVTGLRNAGYKNLYLVDIDTAAEDLNIWTQDCGFIFHLAGVNRPEHESEFMEGNYGFTEHLLNLLIKADNKAPIMISSSIQAALDNPYGKSKKAGEELLKEYSKKQNVPIFIYRFYNLFGKWGRPNYNSVISTFCYNVSRNLPIQISDPEKVITFQYVDDVVDSLLTLLDEPENKEKILTSSHGDKNDSFEYYDVIPHYEKTLGELAKLIQSFKEARFDLSIPNQDDSFVRKLYSTYISYLPENDFSYELKMNVDNRGSFTEFIRTDDRGQVSVNVAKPSITKGNHWHQSKHEKFLVVKGNGLIRFRKIGSSEVIEYPVSESRLEVVEIPPGYTHSIQNVGEDDMVTVMWANEAFNPEKPDTYFEKVLVDEE